MELRPCLMVLGFDEPFSGAALQEGAD